MNDQVYLQELASKQIRQQAERCVDSLAIVCPRFSRQKRLQTAMCKTDSKIENRKTKQEISNCI